MLPILGSVKTLKVTQLIYHQAMERILSFPQASFWGKWCCPNQQGSKTKQGCRWEVSSPLVVCSWTRGWALRLAGSLSTACKRPLPSEPYGCILLPLLGMALKGGAACTPCWNSLPDWELCPLQLCHRAPPKEAARHLVPPPAPVRDFPFVGWEGHRVN